MMRAAWFLGVAAVGVVLVVLTFRVAAGVVSSPPVGGTAPAAFTDVSTQAGIAAAHTACRNEDRIIAYLITGQAWGDYDQDGRPDLYVTGGCEPSTLYRNQGDGTFAVSPLSEAVALPEERTGGAIFADYDNDGWPDLLVLTYTGAVLFHNEAGAGFTDVTAPAGLAPGGHGMTASWGDYDRDGYLDLYVANYGCHPCLAGPEDGAQSRLYHNQGDGTFADVTDAIRVPGTFGFSFVAGWLDYDDDGDLDLYHTNDVRGVRYLRPSVLFRNDGPGCEGWCFTDVSEESGADARADVMGLAVGDYDGDGRLDLYMTNTGWAHMPLTGPSLLLRNQGDGSFREVAEAAGAAVDAIGWGTVFLDYDNDGRHDLYVALGRDPEHEGIWATTNRLLHNDGNGAFHDTTATSGAADTRHSFGVATADYNNDGWPDLLVGNLDDGYALFANAGTAGAGNHRLAVRLRGDGPVNRDAVGARVYLTTTDSRTQVREVMAGSSLGAGNDLALTFGLGRMAVRNLRVVWPNGEEQTFDRVPSDVRWELTYGGAPVVTPLATPSVPVMAAGPVQGARVRAIGLVIPALALVATFGLAAFLIARRLGHAWLAGQLLTLVVCGAVAFQVVHFLEHVLQTGHWLRNPGEQPWITPWGLQATDGFAALAGHHGGRATGTEVLHLAGNWIFFTGLIAIVVAARGQPAVRQRLRGTRIAFWGQLVHVLEHLSLTVTWLFFFLPIGVSTLFGLAFELEGPWAGAIRLWWHFLMNLLPTIAAVVVFREAWRAGLLRVGRAAPEPDLPERPAAAQPSRL